MPADGPVVLTTAPLGLLQITIEAVARTVLIGLGLRVAAGSR